MAGSDGAILVATSRWSDEPLYLNEVVKSGKLPQIVRIVKGHYLGLGVPTLPNPNLASTAIVASAGTSVRVAVQCVKFKDNHKTVNVGPKLAIPQSFDGYFEILNEDGRAVRCIESVQELSRKFPDSCLVREGVKAYVARSDNVDAVGERWRTLPVGELLVLVGEVTAPGLPYSNRSSSTSRQSRFLRCFDSRGDHVYLPMEARGKFSAVAKEDNISGVHKIANLLNKRLPLMVRMVSGQPPAGLKSGHQFCPEMRLLASFDEEIVVALPMVKSNSVCIIPPTVSLKVHLAANADNIKQSKEFLHVHDQCLNKYAQVAHLIQVYDAHFSKNLRFDGQQWRVPVVPLLRRSTSDLLNFLNHDAVTSPAPMPLKTLPENDNKCGSGGGGSGGGSGGANNDVEYDEIDQIYDYIRGFAPLPKHLKTGSGSGNGNNNKESVQRRIDHNRNLYNRNDKANAKFKQMEKSGCGSGSKPIPPPLETIPSRKLGNAGRNPLSMSSGNKPETVTEEAENDVDDVSARHVSASSPVAINGSSGSCQMRKSVTPEEPVAKPRMYRQRSAIPLQRNNHYAKRQPHPQQQQLQQQQQQQQLQLQLQLQQQQHEQQSLTPSPLFNIRYKSMTNLLAADSDTLGSSQSGGRCSGGSAGSAAVRHPPHYLRHPQQQQQNQQLHPLHRPRSLTDLLWDIRWSKSPPKIQLHPTVVADVIPPASSASPRKYDVRRRSVSNLFSGSSSKKHTVFYRL